MLTELVTKKDLGISVYISTVLVIQSYTYAGKYIFIFTTFMFILSTGSVCNPYFVFIH